jgi:hypothetical protein
MSFKFSIGQHVEYKPAGGKLGLYTVTRQLPEEWQAVDKKYQIKNVAESFERKVLECDLRSAGAPVEYGTEKYLRPPY